MSIETTINERLAACPTEEQVDDIFGEFEEYTTSDKKPIFKARNKKLREVMGLRGGGAGCNVTDEDVYCLLRELLSSGDWKE